VYGRRAPAATHPPRALGAAALGSSGTGIAAIGLAHTLLRTSVQEDPADIEPWTPGQAPPPKYASMLGRWWSEGFEFIFSWRDGALRARRELDPADRPSAVFEEIGEDELRGVVPRRPSNPTERGNAPRHPALKIERGAWRSSWHDDGGYHEWEQRSRERKAGGIGRAADI
jgi:hypothetical protein